MLACFRHNAAERRQRSHLSLRWLLPRDTHPRVPCVFLTEYLFWVIYLHVPRHWPDVPVQRPTSIEKFRYNVAQALDRTTTHRHNDTTSSFPSPLLHRPASGNRTTQPGPCPVGRARSVSASFTASAMSAAPHATAILPARFRWWVQMHHAFIALGGGPHRLSQTPSLPLQMVSLPPRSISALRSGENSIREGPTWPGTQPSTRCALERSFGQGGLLPASNNTAGLCVKCAYISPTLALLLSHQHPFVTFCRFPGKGGGHPQPPMIDCIKPIPPTFAAPMLFLCIIISPTEHCLCSVIGFRSFNRHLMLAAGHIEFPAIQ
ncbi:hypothetical protein CH063_06590 [Colletotrichum higginsianum]|nr:hypothetical protein CH063_06590 [Colletotrichum higginsianum]